MVSKYSGDTTLRCEGCLDRESCPFAGKDPDGFCFLETADSNLQMKGREQVLFNYQRMIRDELKILRRLNRYLTRSNDPNALREFRMLSNQVEAHVRNYGVFCGFDEKKRKSMVGEDRSRLMILQQIFGSPAAGPGAKPALKEIFGEKKTAFVSVPRTINEEEEEDLV